MKLPISNQSLHRFAIGGAWFFIVISVLTLGGTLFALASGVPRVELLEVEAGGRSHSATGLSYTGAGGFLLAFFQAAVVLAAAAATLAPNNRYRRLGLATLCGWALLWLLNCYALASIDGEPDILGQALVMTILAASTGYRAYCRWNSPSAPLRPGSRASDIYQPAGAAESLPTVDAALPQDAFGFAADEPPVTSHYGDETPLIEAGGRMARFGRSAAPHVRRAAQATAHGCRIGGQGALLAGTPFGELVAAGGRCSPHHLRTRGGLPQGPPSTGTERKSGG